MRQQSHKDNSNHVFNNNNANHDNNENSLTTTATSVTNLKPHPTPKKVTKSILCVYFPSKSEFTEFGNSAGFSYVLPEKLAKKATFSKISGGEGSKLEVTRGTTNEK